VGSCTPISGYSNEAIPYTPLVLYRTVQYGTVLYCTVYTVQSCIALYHIWM